MSYQLNDVVIIEGYRTPIGKLNGAFSSLKAHELGGVLIQKLLESTGVSGEHVSEVVLGQVLTAGKEPFWLNMFSTKNFLSFLIIYYVSKMIN